MTLPCTTSSLPLAFFPDFPYHSTTLNAGENRPCHMKHYALSPGQKKKKEKIADLGGYFHDLGILLWYDSIPALKSKVILRPHWVTQAVYRLIKLWYDRMIQPGDEWDDEIKSKLSGSDIILLLVSLDFLSIDYVTDTEIPLACEKHENNTAVVIPIILRHCTWEDDFPEVSKLLALPDKAKPLSKWEDPDDAWVAIINGIRKVIRERDETYML